MRKALMLALMLGMGYALAYTPSAWQFIVYLIPLFAFSFLVAAIYVLITGRGTDGSTTIKEKL